MTAALATGPSLTAADRCDQCGSQAYIRAVLPGGGELLFCGHHGRRHESQLRPQALSWHDETDRLATTSSTAPFGER